MQFKFIDAASPEYEKERMLRWEVLRKPLGLPPGSEVEPHDEKSMHLVALENKKVIGCVCCYAESPILGEIFQMAVSEEYRGRGFGRKLMHKMEQALFMKGVRQLYVYALPDSEGFYTKMGYQSAECFKKKQEVSCRLMKKQLCK
ncbi:MAG TPA: GNAT family N-acetyltransferase [Rhabdochlamydiaceae bacterium]|jgi:N-acetylglutamate synthase-like GNAT family acetyltransferase